jgi:hypothetical protein
MKSIKDRGDSSLINNGVKKTFFRKLEGFQYNWSRNLEAGSNPPEKSR